MSELVLTLRQPAQIGDRARDDFVLSTLEHVPGTVVRGAFAASWLASKGVSAPGSPQRAEFLRLFEGGVRFGPLLRPGTEFVPLSVVTHKYRPLETCAEVEYDQAVTGEAPLRCPDCEFPAGPGQGPARRSAAGPAPDQRLHRRVRRRAPRRAVHPGDARGRTGVPRRARRDDPALLSVLAGLGPIRVGGRRTTHGLADVSIRDEPGGPPRPLAQRLDDTTLVVRLRSPGIFTDPQGRPSRDPDPAELTEVLGTPARWCAGGPDGSRSAAGMWPAACPSRRNWRWWPAPPTSSRPNGPWLMRPWTSSAAAGWAYGGMRDSGIWPGRRCSSRAGGPESTKRARRRALMDEVAPLRGVQVRFPQLWPPLLAAMAAHANGDPAATGRLRRLADTPPGRGGWCRAARVPGVLAAGCGLRGGGAGPVMTLSDTSAAPAGRGQTGPVRSVSFIVFVLRFAEPGGVTVPGGPDHQAHLLLDTDPEGRPQLPGTSLAGALREMIRAERGEDAAADLFGRLLAAWRRGRGGRPGQPDLGAGQQAASILRPRRHAPRPRSAGRAARPRPTRCAPKRSCRPGAGSRSSCAGTTRPRVRCGNSPVSWRRGGR